MIQKKAESIATFSPVYIVNGAQAQAEEYRRSSAGEWRQGLAQGSNE
jgi:hypothetical protein